MATQRQAAGEGAGTRPLWFSPPGGEENRRRVLTRDRVVAEALAIISVSGAVALSMRALATRLGVVPAALYRHVRNKDQLCDLILDAVLAEVDCQADPALPWTGQVTVLAHRLRTVLEDHPGIAVLPAPHSQARVLNDVGQGARHCIVRLVYGVLHGLVLPVWRGDGT
jgi:AcrR family transcriptional regulator